MRPHSRRMATATELPAVHRLGYEMPALSHNGLTSLVQTSATLALPSSNTTLHVLGIDDDRGLRDERRAVGRLVRDLRLLPVEQLHRQVDAGLRLQLERLVDGRHLLAEQDVLQAGGLAS